MPLTEQIYWDDGKSIHICESSTVLPRIRLIWTKCQIDVPANKAYKTKDSHHKVTCETCLGKKLKEQIANINAKLDAHYEGEEDECPNCFPERDKYCADHMGDIIDRAYESERDRRMMEGK